MWSCASIREAYVGMSERVGRSWLLLTALSVAVGMSAAAPAVAIETLSEAMVSAYMENPTLRAARARQRASDEIVPQAKSGWRPTITVERPGQHPNSG